MDNCMLSRALKMLRAYYNISQNELAEKLGISNSQLCVVENGQQLPSFELLNKYSNFFEIPMSSILLFSENINTESSKMDRVSFLVKDKMLKILEWVSEINDREKLNGDLNV